MPNRDIMKVWEIVGTGAGFVLLTGDRAAEGLLGRVRFHADHYSGNFDVTLQAGVLEEFDRDLREIRAGFCSSGTKTLTADCARFEVDIELDWDGLVHVQVELRPSTEVDLQLIYRFHVEPREVPMIVFAPQS